MNCERMNSQQRSINSNDFSNSIEPQNQNNSHKHEAKMINEMLEKNEFNNRSKFERSLNAYLGKNIDTIV